MAYTTNRFCWHGLITTNMDNSGAFYPEVMGWKVQTTPMGDSTAHMFAVNDVPLGHYMPPPMEGVPPHWENYLRVDDVDASAAAAVENGGTLLVPGTDIPPGRFAVVTSPSGAAISLFHEADEEGATHHPGGGVHWVELHSTDIDADRVWLEKTFAFEISEMPMPEGAKYYLLNYDGEMRGGAMAGHFPDAPSMWLTWFEVDDADAALARVKSNGGQAYSEPMDMPGVGRMAVVADNNGAAFGIIKPEAKG